MPKSGKPNIRWLPALGHTAYSVKVQPGVLFDWGDLTAEPPAARPAVCRFARPGFAFYFPPRFGDTIGMIRKVVKKYRLGDLAADKADLDYWLSKTPEERVAEIERLREEHYGKNYDRRIKPVVRIYHLVPRKDGPGWKRVLIRVVRPKPPSVPGVRGGNQDLADVEAVGGEVPTHRRAVKKSRIARPAKRARKHRE